MVIKHIFSSEAKGKQKKSRFGKELGYQIVTPPNML